MECTTPITPTNYNETPVIYDMAQTLQNLQKQKPPMECTFCGKVYRSFSGISYHIIKYHSHSHVTAMDGRDSVNLSSTKTSFLTYAEAQKMVKFDFKEHIYHKSITAELPIELQKVQEEEEEEEEEEVSSVSMSPVKSARSAKSKKSRSRLTMVRRKAATVKRNQPIEDIKPDLPSAVFQILADVSALQSHIADRKAYYRFIEKSIDELDEEVEYGMDEEDYIWLESANEARKNENLSIVQPEIFEMLLDRLEKESHFETRTLNGDPYNMIDDDAVCSICSDGECSNSNVILFCDMCNLAVHQECYGVPYIPEGQWLCRRCLQSPSKPVDCALCPMKNGAFKQTDDNRWAHVVCALWIPEVCFANTVFLEPIDSIANVPPARWRLRCYICKKREGAAIQCFKTNCYTAFHVTCAQQGGLYMKMEPGRNEFGQPTVKKSAYCDMHTPKHADQANLCLSDYCSDDDSDTGSVHSQSSNVSKSKSASMTPSAKLKEVQKKLLEKENLKMPVVHIPFVPAHRLNKIVAQVAIQKKMVFIQQLQSYWMLKRQSRNGVPLLRRLQSSTGSGINKNHKDLQNIGEWSKSEELKEQLKCWQQLRHDLERVRLLIELIRKREKIKKEQYKLEQKVVNMKLKPLQLVMQRTLQQLQEKDTSHIFAEPVKPEDAPDYHSFITDPMDFSTMNVKLKNYEYENFDQFEKDFNLMIQNCLDFNNNDTLYYRTALRVRKECKPILKCAQKRIKQAGIDPMTGMHFEEGPEILEHSTHDDDDVSTLIENPFMTLDEKIEELELKLEITSAIKSALLRLSRQKMLRTEIAKLRRRKRSLEHPPAPVKVCHLNGHVEPSAESPIRTSEEECDSKKSVAITTCDTSNMETNSPEHASAPPIAPIVIPKSVTNNPSPGRSRRSGILFKKKQYEPSNPSPLMVSNSGIISPSRTSPIKLRLRLDSNDFASIADSGRSDLSEKVRHEPLEGETENYDPNIVEKDEKERLERHKQQLLNSSLNFLKKTVNLKQNRIDKYFTPKEKNCITPKEKNCKDTDNEVQACLSPPPLPSPSPTKESGCLQSGNGRKRTYSSSAASDTEGTISAKKKVQNKRGRKGLPKLCFDEEFGGLEGLGNIQCGVYMISPEDVGLKDPKIEPKDIAMFQLIWAKCRGYPSYPALTIDSTLPPTGYIVNGVPIPIPPQDILDLNDEESNYLVLFFDARRTWQWLPREKIEPLGVDSRLDETKLMESRKPSMRKNVQEAYKRAIAFRRRIEVGENGDTDDSSNQSRTLGIESVTEF